MPYEFGGEKPAYPAADEVHVWLAEVPPGGAKFDRPGATLSPEERQRAGRFIRVEDRWRFAFAHETLRQLLGNYLARDPARLEFVTGPAGKPALAEGSGPALEFNLTHSGRWVGVAVADRRRVGIDLEAYRPAMDMLAIARGQFSRAEAEALAALAPGELVNGFFRCWTRKEAYAKALGEGLQLPLNQFSVAFAAGVAPAIEWSAADPDAAARWTVHDLAVEAGYAGAVVVEGRGIRLLARRWKPPA